MRKGISTIIRVRDEEKTLKLSLETAKNLCDQIVFIDHNSNDNSYEIAKKFKEENNLENMIIEKFEYETRNREATLADMYNYALSYVTGEWCIKWDGDLFLEKDKCLKIRNAIEKYNNIKQINGLYLSNRIIYPKIFKMSKNFGSELGVFRVIPGFVYVNYHKENSIVVGQKAYKQEKILIASDVLNDPIIWHIRIKSYEELVKSRFILSYYRENLKISFEEYVDLNKKERTWEEIFFSMFNDLIDIEKNFLPKELGDL